MVNERPFLREKDMHITSNSSSKQIFRFLEAVGKSDLIALCTYLNNKSDDYELPTYGSRQQLLWGLQEVDRHSLTRAIISLFDDTDLDDEEDEDEESDGNSNDDED